MTLRAEKMAMFERPAEQAEDGEAIVFIPTRLSSTVRKAYRDGWWFHGYCYERQEIEQVRQEGASRAGPVAGQAHPEMGNSNVRIIREEDKTRRIA